jgi:hypothetical protein
METIGQTISRVRNDLKAVRDDSFVTDRYIYSVILKYAKAAIRRQDNESKILRYTSIFRTLPCIELVEVNKVEACCSDIKSDCTIMRSKEKLPPMIEGSHGPIFGEVTSIDGMERFNETSRATFVSMTKVTTFKYNKNKYYWFMDGHLYFPNIEWEAVSARIIPEGDISYMTCDEDDKCKPMQERETHVPDYLFAEIETQVLNELTIGLKIPSDGPDDKQNQLR